MTGMKCEGGYEKRELPQTVSVSNQSKIKKVEKKQIQENKTMNVFKF